MLFSPILKRQCPVIHKITFGPDRTYTDHMHNACVPFVLSKTTMFINRYIPVSPRPLLRSIRTQVLSTPNSKCHAGKTLITPGEQPRCWSSTLHIILRNQDLLAFPDIQIRSTQKPTTLHIICTSKNAASPVSTNLHARLEMFLWTNVTTPRMTMRTHVDQKDYSAHKSRSSAVEQTRQCKQASLLILHTMQIFF